MFYTVYDLKNISFEKMKLNDSFTVPMYYIVEYFARRRADKEDDGVPFMNLYPTVEDEGSKKWFSTIPVNNYNFSQEVIQKEGEEFAKLNLDTTPNLNADETLDFIEKVLNKGNK